MRALPVDLKAVTAWVIVFKDGGDKRELSQSKNTMKVGACATGGGGGGGGGGGSEAQAPNKSVAANTTNSFLSMIHPP
jgi:hypothetical protein